MVTIDTLSQLYVLASNSPHREICGILTATGVYPITNIAEKNHHFIMHKSEYFRLINRLNKENQTILAVYHSHINGDPTPSSADLDAAKRIGYNYLIVTTQQYCWVEV